MKMVIVCVLSLHEAVLIKLCAFLSSQFHRNNLASKILPLSEHVLFIYLAKFFLFLSMYTFHIPSKILPLSEHVYFSYT